MKPHWNYAAPYITETTWADLNREIESTGFVTDPFLQEEPKRPVYGLNLAFGWPLPHPLNTPYEELAKTLAKLDPGLYVYPHKQTHVTVMTLVNFKDHQDPSQEEVRTIQRVAQEVEALIPPILSNLKLRPFRIDVGPPVLSSRAAFLPLLNPTQEVSRLREEVRHSLWEILSLKVTVPQAIHSTIVRFISVPSNAPAFVSSFESTVGNFRLGEATINEFILTAETKPYMIDGEILHRFILKE